MQVLLLIQVDASGKTALVHLFLGSIDYPISIEKTVLLLIKSGAEVNKPDKNGKTPLMYAVRWNPEIIRLLVNVGAEINAVDNNGWSVLMHAAKQPVSFDILVKLGADTTLRNNEGKTAFDILYSDRDMKNLYNKILSENSKKRKIGDEE